MATGFVPAVGDLIKAYNYVAINLGNDLDIVMQTIKSCISYEEYTPWVIFHNYKPVCRVRVLCLSVVTIREPSRGVTDTQFIAS